MLPVIRSLQSTWPTTRLTWVIGRLEAELLGDMPGIEFVVFDKSTGWLEYLKLHSKFSKRRFDILLHMQTSMRANMASLMIPADLRLGFDFARAKDHQAFFTTDRIESTACEHVMDGFLGFLTTLGIKDKSIQWDIPVPSEALDVARKYIPEGQKTLIISPCANARFRNFRNWHVEGYAALADYGIQTHGLRVILMGGPTALEKQYGEQISKLVKSPILNLIGKTGLKELLALLGRATVVLAPDSGPAHIANAAGTPVIGLYATTNPSRARAYLSEKWLINQYPEAVRAFLGKSVDEVPWGTRVRNEEAMCLIKIEAVTQKLDQLMASLSRH